MGIYDANGNMKLNGVDILTGGNAKLLSAAPGIKGLSSITTMSEKNNLLKVAEQVPPSPIDIIIMLDSSGSVADVDFSNWQAEIDYAASMVDAWVDSDAVTVDVRVALINYSGCSPKLSFEECQKQNK